MGRSNLRVLRSTVAKGCCRITRTVDPGLFFLFVYTISLGVDILAGCCLALFRRFCVCKAKSPLLSVDSAITPVEPESQTIILLCRQISIRHDQEGLVPKSLPACCGK
jgi:hypothetical protein